MNFGQKLQHLRNRAGLSQSQLADKAGISIKTIQSWEISRRTPRWIHLLAKLAEGLNVPIETLVPDDAQNEVGKSTPKKPRAPARQEK